MSAPSTRGVPAPYTPCSKCSYECQSCTGVARCMFVDGGDAGSRPIHA